MAVGGCIVHNEAASDMRESNPATTLCRLKGTRMQKSNERTREMQPFGFQQLWMKIIQLLFKVPLVLL